MKSSVEATRASPPQQQTAPLSDRIYEALKDRIANGAYAADERLPGEYDLAASFEVSRPIVREALERLRNDGLIYSRRGAGSFARPGHLNGTAQRVGFAPVESVADIQRCYEFRLTIEPEAAAYAALRRNDEAMAAIAAALALMSDATRQQRHREDADFAFHIAVAKAANNHYHLSALQALREHIAVGMKLHGLALIGAKPGLQRVFAEHSGVFDAIQNRKPELAAERMRAHLQGSLDRLFEGRLLDLAL
jgi:GntR family transcriptional repressor for pyruvate dehydrogenase complex